MASDEVVIVTYSLERWVVVAVDKYHGDIGKDVVTKLAKDQIGLSSLQGPHGNERPIVFG